MKFDFGFILVCSSFILLFNHCKNPDFELQKELDTAVFKLDMMQKQLDSGQLSKSGDLIHLVFFNAKDDLSEEQLERLIEELKQLQGIPVVKYFSIGSYKDLGDPRALSDYELALSIGFENEADYETYQKHPKHLTVKMQLEELLESAPMTFDFIKD